MVSVVVLVVDGSIYLVSTFVLISSCLLSPNVSIQIFVNFAKTRRRTTKDSRCSHAEARPGRSTKRKITPLRFGAGKIIYQWKNMENNNGNTYGKNVGRMWKMNENDLSKGGDVRTTLSSIWLGAEWIKQLIVHRSTRDRMIQKMTHSPDVGP